jgi:hypothetical protein
MSDAKYFIRKIDVVCRKRRKRENEKKDEYNKFFHVQNYKSLFIGNVNSSLTCNRYNPYPYF